MVVKNVMGEDVEITSVRVEVDRNGYRCLPYYAVMGCFKSSIELLKIFKDPVMALDYVDHLKAKIGAEIEVSLGLKPLEDLPFAPTSFEELSS